LMVVMIAFPIYMVLIKVNCGKRKKNALLS